MATDSEQQLRERTDCLDCQSCRARRIDGEMAHYVGCKGCPEHPPCGSVDCGRVETYADGTRAFAGLCDRCSTTQVAPVESTYTVEGALILANDLARTKHENDELRSALARIPDELFAERNKMADRIVQLTLEGEQMYALLNGHQRHQLLVDRGHPDA